MTSDAKVRDADPPTWSVYLVRRADDALYTGIATDVERRLEEHRAGRGSKALRGRGPLTLAAHAEVGERAEALRVERRIKALAKRDKEALTRNAGAVDALVAEVRRAARSE